MHVYDDEYLHAKHIIRMYEIERDSVIKKFPPQYANFGNVLVRYMPNEDNYHVYNGCWDVDYKYDDTTDKYIGFATFDKTITFELVEIPFERWYKSQILNIIEES